MGTDQEPAELNPADEDFLSQPGCGLFVMIVVPLTFAAALWGILHVIGVSVGEIL